MSEIKKPVKRGLSFSLLIPQLTTDYKKSVISGKVKLTDTFNITSSSEKYLKDLIRKDLKDLVIINGDREVVKPTFFQRITAKLSK